MQPLIYLMPFYFGVQLCTVRLVLNLRQQSPLYYHFKACLVKLVKASTLSIMSVVPSDGTNIAAMRLWWNQDGVQKGPDNSLATCSDTLLYLVLLNVIMTSQVPLDWTQANVLISWAHYCAMFQNWSDCWVCGALLLSLHSQTALGTVTLR